MAGLQLPRVVLRCIFVWKIFEDIFTLRIIITNYSSIYIFSTNFLRLFNSTSTRGSTATNVNRIAIEKQSI